MGRISVLKHNLKIISKNYYISILYIEMPAPVKVTVKNKIYTTPILTGEMDNIASQITNAQDNIRSLKVQLDDQYNILANLNNQLIALYIQQTGSFPE
jgi:hypothetical protein